jgi:hypothetical protein
MASFTCKIGAVNGRHEAEEGDFAEHWMLSSGPAAIVLAVGLGNSGHVSIVVKYCEIAFPNTTDSHNSRSSNGHQHAIILSSDSSVSPATTKEASR